MEVIGNEFENQPKIIRFYYKKNRDEALTLHLRRVNFLLINA